jgi:hypothetical protein
LTTGVFFACDLLFVTPLCFRADAPDPGFWEPDPGECDELESQWEAQQDDIYFAREVNEEGERDEAEIDEQDTQLPDPDAVDLERIAPTQPKVGDFFRSYGYSKCG